MCVCVRKNSIPGQPGYREGRVRGIFHGLSTLKPDIGPPVKHRLATRPPLAGPYAFSRIPIPVWNRPRVFLMHDISNTWLFTDFSSGYLFLQKNFIILSIVNWKKQKNLLNCLN